MVMSGGSLSADWFALVGATAISNISETFVDKIFIGVDGIHPGAWPDDKLS